ncbi:MAG: helix-turn-helix transcriptional regulator [Planctomycetes bacterium]|nr:helix-turn-helix transcriptional regulator [Planctomycetota bacterium]
MASGIASIPVGILGFNGQPDAEPADCRPLVMGRTLEAGQQPFHWRNHDRPSTWCLHYTLAGSGMFRDDAAGGDQPVPAGSAFIVPFPSATSYWLPPGGRWEFVWLLVGGALAERHAQVLFRAHGPLWTLPANSPVIRLLHELHGLAASGADDPCTGSALCYRLIAELWRQHRQATGLPAEIADACDHALRNLDDGGLGVAALAKRAGCSQAHFSRLFHRHVGSAPYAWILDQRLRLAMDLISAGSDLRDAARRAGFASYANFSHRFSQRFRITPSSLARGRET